MITASLRSYQTLTRGLALTLQCPKEQSQDPGTQIILEVPTLNHHAGRQRAASGPATLTPAVPPSMPGGAATARRPVIFRGLCPCVQEPWDVFPNLARWKLCAFDLRFPLPSGKLT